MTTQKQIDANRRNAQKSTGPRTAEGKAAVAQNALKHGLRADKPEMPEAEWEGFDRFFKATFEHFKPEGYMEETLTERIAVANWRLKRAVRIESEMIDYQFTLARNLRAIYPRAHKADPIVSWGERIWREFQHHGAYENFRRYEAHLERSLYRALHELQRLQRARKGEDVPLPAVLDIDITRAVA